MAKVNKVSVKDSKEKQNLLALLDLANTTMNELLEKYAENSKQGNVLNTVNGNLKQISEIIHSIK